MTRPLRILNVCNEFGTETHGGIAAATIDLSKWMLRRGHEVTISGAFDLRLNPELEQQIHSGRGFQFSPIMLPKVLNRLHYKLEFILARIWFANHLNRLIRKFQPDLIEVPDYGGWGAFISNKTIPLVARLQGTHLLYDKMLGRTSPSILQYCERRFLKNSTAWIGVSNYALKHTKQLVPGKRLEKVIFNPVDTSFFSPEVDPEEISGRIVFVNSLGPRKGIEELVKAFDQVLPKYPHASLVVAGMGSEDYVQKLRSSVSDTTQKLISFTGFQQRDAVRSLYRSAQICCFPSKAETFGIGPAEAMSCGRPVIYMSNGPGPELITNELSGLLVNGSSIEEISAALDKFLGNRDLRMLVGSNARKVAVESFDIERCAVENESFYHSLRRGNKER
jgi:glycosyltransferase involved in cell wall biosynthesis